MTGDAFIQLADELLRMSPAPKEAVCRTAISRAYYGAFHLAKDYLVDLGVPVGKQHGDVWTTFGHSAVLAAKQLATRLAVLHEHRRIADYELSSAKPANIQFARDNLARAMDVVQLLALCRQEPTRSGIKAGIEAYRRKSGATGK